MSDRERHQFKLGEFVRSTRRNCWHGYVAAYADDHAPGCVKVYVWEDRCGNRQRKPFYRVIHQNWLEATGGRLNGYPD